MFDSKPGSQNRYRAFYTLKIILVILKEQFDYAKFIEPSFTV